MEQSALDSYVTMISTGRGYAAGCDLNTGLLEKSLAHIEAQMKVPTELLRGAAAVSMMPSVSTSDRASEMKAKCAAKVMLAQVEEQEKATAFDDYDRAMAILEP